MKELLEKEKNKKDKFYYFITMINFIIKETFESHLSFCDYPDLI